jgi:membrane protease YdiL (CAAX protease family)
MTMLFTAAKFLRIYDAGNTALWFFAGAPLLEEAIFRYGLQQSLELAFNRRNWNPARAAGIANLLASLAFALSHQLDAPIAFRLLWVFPSLVLGALWSCYRRYSVCVLAHVWFNLCLLGVAE